jgi:DNA-binding transcriptional ArsR family regulator
MSNEAADVVFEALGEANRRRILELLGEGAHSVGALALDLPIGRPAVSRHLKVLTDAGLVRSRAAGTRNLYALAPEGLAAAQQWLVGTWDHVLAEYRHAVEHATAQDDRRGGNGA